jgi:hypothetical protein
VPISLLPSNRLQKTDPTKTSATRGGPRQKRKGRFPPTAKQICSGEERLSWPSQGQWLQWNRPPTLGKTNPEAGSLFQPTPFMETSQPDPGVLTGPIEKNFD